MILCSLILAVACAPARPDHPAPGRSGSLPGPGATVHDRLDAADPTTWGEWSYAARRPGAVIIVANSAEFTPSLRLSTPTPRPNEWPDMLHTHSSAGRTHVIHFPQPGQTYRIHVGPDSLGRGGSYTLRLLDRPDAPPIVPGEIVTGALESGDPHTADSPLHHSSHHDDWQLVPATADSLVVRLYTFGFAPRVDIGTVEGTEFRRLARSEESRRVRVGRQSVHVARLAFRPEAGRRYLLRVTGHQEQTGLAGYGTYTLHVGSAGDGAGTLVPASPPAVASRFRANMEMEDWVLRPAHSGDVTIAVDSVWAASELRLQVATPDGFMPVAETRGAPHEIARMEVRVEADREYRIQVRGEGDGPYLLRIRPRGKSGAP